MRRTALIAFAVAAGLAAPAQSRVAKFEIVSVESPTFAGRAFGNTGTYDKIIARATMTADPANPCNAVVVDLDRAPKNGAGQVEFTADVAILKPTDPRRGNGRLFYDVLNRGNKIGLVLMNDAPGANNPTKAEHAGNGFLMEQGYTVVWSAWQGDVPAGADRMLLSVPVAAGITGTSREEFIFETMTNPATADLSYPVDDFDTAKARLTVRAREGDARQTPADLRFNYLGATKIQIERPAGFDAGAIYEFIYPAKDPRPMGLGFAATRDIVSFLRYEAKDPAGNANPLGQGTIKHAFALGISQSGRFLRDLLYQGFNEDEAGRVVFDGLNVHIAGSRKTFINYRFAQPGRYSRQHEDHLYPGDQFPFAYAVSSDPLSGRTDGVLAKCLAAANCPRIIHTDSDTEVFQGRVHLNTIDTAGKPLAEPANVRHFLLAGVPHFNAADAKSGPTANCQLPSNPLHGGPAMRALLVTLDAWVSEGTAPPASRYPNLADGTLASPEGAYPALPGLAYKAVVNPVHLIDHTKQPPTAGYPYLALIARVDGDGHAIGALRLPAVDAPVATYLGWNLRRQGFGEGALCSLSGSTIPFAKTRAERLAANDPRPSIEERYPTPGSYAATVAEAADKLVAARLMLPADAQRIKAAAAAQLGQR
jgi:hypothetical protein